MPAPLRLTLTDYLDPTRWRWVLSDAKGGFLADHTVQLDPSTREYQGFVELAGYLNFYHEAYPPERQLEDLGDWIGVQVFGGLRAKLWQQRATPARPVQVIVPQSAQDLLFRPFELARFDNGQTFRKAGIRFVYQREGVETPAGDKLPAEPKLRILAVFSLPVSQNPLNLRRERYGLQRFVLELNQTKGLAVELRVLQYGATRETLEYTLQDGDGWDIVHLSGHGDKGELLLEDDRGGTDSIGAEELGDLLAPSAERLKLLILDTCYSGAGSHAAARVQLGLDRVQVRETGAEGEPLAQTARTVLPSLAQNLAERLDCAALAMRYPVGDDFACELMLSLYDKLLDRNRPLPAALHLALDEALASKVPKPPLSSATPILLGGRAAELRLTPPQQSEETLALPKTGLGIAFPEEPPRFVGRLQPMLRASQALASRSPERGVLFYGMPGAGKTACALELAYRHAEGRFKGHVWYKAPEAGSDIATALYNLLFEIQRQLNAPQLGLTTALDDPQRFREYTLPRLRDLLQRHSLLLVLDNLENLLTASGGWRDPLWGEVLAALLSHHGPSRVVLTSRRVPADLEQTPKLQREAIHALSFAESVLLARELPHLNGLFGEPDGLDLLQQTLRAVQGHPKLLELADGLAADRNKLAERVKAAELELAGQGEVLDAFFAVGLPKEGETRRTDQDFMRELQAWTAGVSALLTPAARLLFQVLCNLEAVDRKRVILDSVWKHILSSLDTDNIPGRDVIRSILAEPELGFPQALAALAQVGLLGVEAPPELDAAMRSAIEQQLAGQNLPVSIDDILDQFRAQTSTFTIHPGVAEATRAATNLELKTATDTELGDYFIAMHEHGLKTEMEGGGETVVDAARRATPYLLRRERWKEAATLLDQMLGRDQSPETLAYALPLLRRIVDATADTPEGLQDAGILAKTLNRADRFQEAEPLLRDLIKRSVDRGEYRTASVAAGNLLNLLEQNGHLDEALTLAGEMAGYTQKAGLGPWTQLGNECQRLQILNALGRYDEVLDAVEIVRSKLAALPEQGELEEAVRPWGVREGLLGTGHEAAMRSQHHEQALALNAENVKYKKQRGASALQLARTRFNDTGSLLRLERYKGARQLLLDCRAVYGAERDIEYLGKVWGALANLADRTGDRADAVRFVEIALGYHYQLGQPEDCAIGHNNLSTYLRRLGKDTATVLAHRLAAATIRWQMQSGLLPTTVRNLALIELPATPPSFDSVADTVEQVEGVRFRAMFGRLPRTADDGDAAIATVWQMALEMQQQR
ncbi:MAG: CHAT domain-containing protein [Candidatus Methylumidiphilus sp.]